MAVEPDSPSDVREVTRRRRVSRTVAWSYAATAVAIGLWITLVVVNRSTGGEVRPGGSQAGLPLLESLVP